jgi:hypothetical protein
MEQPKTVRGPKNGFSDNHRWALDAKAAGYPLCEQCQEPIAKAFWGKSKLCSTCRTHASTRWQPEDSQRF